MTTHALEIKSLRFAYSPSEAPILDIESLTLDRGEQILVKGKSGSGKSTLLNLIAGLIDPPADSRAAIRVAGRKIHELSGAQRDAFRGQHIGMVFQAFNLLHGFTALENVMAAMAFSKIPAAEHAKRAKDLLDRLDVLSRSAATPDELSLGQQQRVAVARALACGPDLVLADEPTASLDPESGNAAVELLRSVCEERSAALLVVSHDPALEGVFSRVETIGITQPA